MVTASQTCMYSIHLFVPVRRRRCSSKRIRKRIYPKKNEVDTRQRWGAKRVISDNCQRSGIWTNNNIYVRLFLSQTQEIRWILLNRRELQNNNTFKCSGQSCFEIDSRSFQIALKYIYINDEQTVKNKIVFQMRNNYKLCWYLIIQKTTTTTTTTIE